MTPMTPMTADELYKRAAAYAKKSDAALSTVSRKLLGSGVVLNNVKNGADIGSRRLQRAFEQLEAMESALEEAG